MSEQQIDFTIKTKLLKFKFLKTKKHNIVKVSNDKRN